MNRTADMQEKGKRCVQNVESAETRTCSDYCSVQRKEKRRCKYTVCQHLASLMRYGKLELDDISMPQQDVDVRIIFTCIETYVLNIPVQTKMDGCQTAYNMKKVVFAVMGDAKQILARKYLTYHSCKSKPGGRDFQILT